ncbi:hypothetical protein ABEB36_001757 [Hypothenemus hampei]
MPPHGQRRSVERAKTGDILKAKIQQRPPRQELERRHILEADALHADPSLAERQRMLKKARLADQLNDQLSHRPGPLELIQKNILHTEEPIEQAVKTGKIPYKATSEGALKRPQHPNNYINPEEDSLGSSEGDNSSTVSPGPSDVLETAAKSAGIVVSLIQPAEGVVLTTSQNLSKDNNNEIVFADLCRPLLNQQQQIASSPAASLVSSTSTLSPLSSVASPIPCQSTTPVPPPPPLPRPVKCDAPGKDKNNRKKSKSKSAAQKTRTIKFHEYKGPPSAHKSSASGGTNGGESSYDLLLKQQTLLLQFQLQLQHKFPQIILPAQKSPESNAPSVSSSSSNGVSNSPGQIQQQIVSVASPCENTSVPRITGKLEDMKVSDLKAELKKRSLPVSGCKPQLIERLKSFSTQQQSDIISPASVESNNTDQDLGSPKDEHIQQELMEISEPCSPAPPSSTAPQQQQQEKSKEDIVREQQRQIEELQRELTLSQMKLQALNSSAPNAQLLLQKHLQAKQQQQQQNVALQMRQLQAEAKQVNEEQQRLQQQQHAAFQNQKNVNGLVINRGSGDATFLYQLMQCKPGSNNKFLNGHARTNSLPNFVLTADVKREFIEEVKQPPEIKVEFTDVRNSPKPPPLYEEATKQMNKKNSVKSQIVDDVLEILIKNGELPPSAASYPSTPGSANAKAAQEPPIYPNVNASADLENNVQMIEDPSAALTGIDPTELLDSLENMDFNQLVFDLGNCPATTENNNISDQVPMDTDEWLESLIPNDQNFNTSLVNCQSGNNTVVGIGYDPVLGMAQDPFDPFNLEEEFRTPADITLSWDKVDYAT